MSFNFKREVYQQSKHMTKDEVRDMHFYENMISKLIDASNDSYKTYVLLRRELLNSIIERINKHHEQSTT